MGKRSLTPCLLMALQLLAILFAMFPAAPQPAEAAFSPDLTVYFANWTVYSSEFGEVQHLPWPSINRIHHAFWKIVPKGSDYAVEPIDAWADTDPDNPKAHFPQYARLSEQYPDTEILLSIGGWSHSGYFSKMASSKEGRASFIASCIAVLQKYPFLNGLDLDWEYPGVARPAKGKDQGNPVAGDDWANYPKLLKELRLALDQHFGPGTKQLTICAPAGLSNLQKQNYPSLFSYVDGINLMTYDMTGSYAARTGHHAPLYGEISADTAVRYLLNQGVPPEKILIGSPLYSHGWKNVSLGDNPQGASAQGKNHGGAHLYRQLAAFERAAGDQETLGWHAGYDQKAEAAYLWNDLPASPYYRNFLSYENKQSLTAKIDYIHAMGLQGLMLWQSGGDDAGSGFPFIRHAFQHLKKQKDN